MRTNEILSKAISISKTVALFVFGIPVLLVVGIPILINTIFLYLRLVFRAFSKQEIISAFKLTAATAILLLFGCLFGYWFAKLNLSDAIYNSSINLNEIIFSIISLPFFFGLIFSCLAGLISIISSEYTILANKLNSADFPKPDSGLKIMCYIFLSIYFASLLVFGWATK
jgi:hypothetical protein